MKILLVFPTNVAAVAAFNVAAACCSPRVNRWTGCRILRHDDTEIRFVTEMTDPASIQADLIVRCSRLDVCPSTWFAKIR